MRQTVDKKERDCTKCSKRFLAYGWLSVSKRGTPNVFYRSICNQCRNKTNVYRLRIKSAATPKKPRIDRSLLSKEAISLLTNERNREWRKSNPEKWKAANRLNRHRRRALGRINSSEWIAKVMMLGNRCQCCNRTEPDVKITIDHIVPVSKGGTNHIDNIQPLCMKCNQLKSTKIVNTNTLYNIISTNI
jgi:5-methylcytosine-specific restriction endonuclease McrA